jgi:hypothetical protein
MKAFNGILGGFNRTASKLDRLAKRNHDKADRKVAIAERLDEEVAALRAEAKASELAATNIRSLLGDHE